MRRLQVQVIVAVQSPYSYKHIYIFISKQKVYSDRRKSILKTDHGMILEMLTTLIDFISRNQDGIVLTVLGLIAGPIVSNLFVKPSSRPRTLKVVVGDSNTVINNYYESKGNQTKQEDTFALVAILVLASCLMYVRWFDEVLLVLASTSTFLFGFSLGVALYLYLGGYVRGVSWLIYFFTVIATSVVTFYLTIVASRPEYWPDLPTYYNDIAKIKNMKGILSVGNPDIYLFLLVQLFGIALVLLLQVRLTLSMLHYMISAYVVDSKSASKFARSLIAKTHAYQDPARTWFICIIFSLLAYFSLNGEIFTLFKKYY